MKKVFVSVGMSGREDRDVARDIYDAYWEIYGMFDGDVKIFDNWGCVGPSDAGRLWYLGEAIKKLGDCDACYFCKDWRKYKGCRIEREVCELYGIEIIEEGS